MNRTFTVNVPRNFPDVDSDTAERMAEVALRDRIPLTLDAVGSGPKTLRLTVDEGTAQRLRDRAGGSMALAFRRLFSTVAEHAGAARRVSSSSLRPRLPESKPGPSCPASRTTSAWYQLSTPWSKLTTGQREYYEEQYRAGALGLASASVSASSRVQTVRESWLARVWSDPVARWILVLFVGVFVLALAFGGWPSVSGGAAPASSGPSFPVWRPR